MVMDREIMQGDSARYDRLALELVGLGARIRRSGGVGVRGKGQCKSHLRQRPSKLNMARFYPRLRLS